MKKELLLSGALSVRLYETYARPLPIIDFHNHLSPRELTEDRSYRDLYRLWIAPDPYKHRAMRMCGVPERLITGDALRDESIDKVIRMLPIMEKLRIDTICFNFMAHIGWLRTAKNLPERGDASVTGFRLADFTPTGDEITEEALWSNYTYFVRAVMPEAERHGIKLALHPDDPPLPRLGEVSRIMISYENIRRALDIAASPNMGVTMCQACYHLMGEELSRVVPALADRIFFVHFRNVIGTRTAPTDPETLARLREEGRLKPCASFVCEGNEIPLTFTANATFLLTIEEN